MRFSEQWLREWVDPDVDVATLTRDLSMMGLEVDAVEAAAPAFSGVVVGRVTTVEAHPQADNLSVCTVDDGSGKALSVVCGAPNVAAGMKAPFARVGAVLPNGVEVSAAEVRGTHSQGMLCSAAELGLSEDADGLLTLADDATVGADLRDYARLDDRIIDVELTPDRGDCLSIRGIARDLAARYRLAPEAPRIDPVGAVTEAAHSVHIEAPDACPRYCGRVIEGVNPQAPTPDWMAERLRRSGVRPIAALVDITNYVMLELGQPMHAFDRDRLRGDVRVRWSQQDEGIALLDERSVATDGRTLVIADDRGPIALAGIMGGSETAVGYDTRTIFLESACFLPWALAGRARHYIAHTDSSHRFERGVDFELSPVAIERATKLILEIAGGQPGPAVDTVEQDRLPSRAPFALRSDRISRLLGFEIGAEEIEATLAALGIAAERNEAGWQVTPPSWRYDLELEADVIEEVVRIHGCDRVPRTQPQHTARIEAGSEQDVPLARLRQTLVERGWFEAVTYSFVDPELQQRFDPEVEPLPLANPISSDMSVMRTHLWPGLISALRHNRNRQLERVRLFETGLRFVPERDAEGGLAQIPALAGIADGPVWPEQWDAPARPVDFYDVKGDLEALMAQVGPERFAFVPAEHPALHPGQTARIDADGQPCGWLGALHPRLSQALDLAAAPILFELDLAALSRAILPTPEAVSKFPSIRRDLAVIVDEAVTAAGLLGSVREVAPEELRDAFVFDVYRGQGVDSGRKSLALGLILQGSSRTLTDGEVEAASARIVSHLQSTHGATLRE
jgi:phenylalanyl-tRNA synthetase beta chain